MAFDAEFMAILERKVAEADGALFFIPKGRALVGAMHDMIRDLNGQNTAALALVQQAETALDLMVARSAGLIGGRCYLCDGNTEAESIRHADACPVALLRGAARACKGGVTMAGEYREVQLRSDSKIYHLCPTNRRKTLCGLDWGNRSQPNEGSKPCPKCQKAMNGGAA